MKVLMLVFNVFERGTYFRALQFARNLVEMKVEPTIIVTSRKRGFRVSEHNREGIKIVETPSIFSEKLRSGWDLFNLICRINLVKTKEFDIVHAFETRPVNIYPALIMKNQGIPLVFDWADWFGRGGSVEERPQDFIRYLLRPVESYYEEHFRDRASATTVICSVLKERAIELGVLPRSISLLWNGLDVSSHRAYSMCAAREKLGLKKNDFIIGYVGSLFYRDLQLMTEAMRIVLQNHNQVIFMHIGLSNYNIDKEQISPNKFIQTGLVDDENYWLHLSACDACWLPLLDSNANKGRFPLKISSYLAAGKPIIATNVGDVAEVIRINNAGVIVDPTSSAIAEAVLSLSYEKERAYQLGCEAFRLSRNGLYSWRTRTEELAKVYSDLVF